MDALFDSKQTRSGGESRFQRCRFLAVPPGAMPRPGGGECCAFGAKQRPVFGGRPATGLLVTDHEGLLVPSYLRPVLYVPIVTFDCEAL